MQNWFWRTDIHINIVYILYYGMSEAMVAVLRANVVPDL